MGGEVVAESRGKEFATIVTLHTFNDHMELSVNKGEETMQYGRGLGYLTQGECPGVMCVVIQNNKVIRITRETNDRRGPQVTM